MIAMKYYTSTTQFNCGIDLHARQMYVCVMDRDGKKLVHTNIKNNDFAFFLKLVAPYRHDLTVCAECMFGWYWLADACQDAGLHFVLAHALYLKAIHGGKNKNDRIDSEKIAHLLRTNLIPPAYVYPARKRPLRALAAPAPALRLEPQRTALPHPVPSTGSQPAHPPPNPLQPRIVGQATSHARNPIPSGSSPCKTTWPSSAITTRNWPASKKNFSSSPNEPPAATSPCCKPHRASAIISA